MEEVRRMDILKVQDSCRRVKFQHNLSLTICRKMEGQGQIGDHSLPQDQISETLAGHLLRTSNNTSKGHNQVSGLMGDHKVMDLR